MVTLISEETLRTELNEFYDKIDDRFVDKLKEICIVNDRSEQSIVHSWMAFASNRNIVSADAPSVELLNEFESYEFMKESRILHKTAQKKSSNVNTNDNLRKKFDFIEEYAQSLEKTKNTTTIDVAMDDDYDYDGPKYSETRDKIMVTPSKDVYDVSTMTSVMVKNESFNANSSQITMESENSDILSYYGDSQSNSDWKSDSIEMKHVIDLYDKSLALTGPFKFMTSKISECNDVMNECIEQMSDKIREKLEIDSWGRFSVESAAERYYIGRVKCDNNKEKLDEVSALIEGASSITDNETIRLDLSRLKAFSIFPGQIFACNAINENGKTLIVREIVECDDIIVKLPKTVPSLKKPLNLLVAAGPFTSKDSYHYQYLRDILNYAKEYTPDYIILMGPFVDSKNDKLNDLNESLDRYFNDQMRLIIDELIDVKTQAIIIPSHRDLNHFNIVPSPPFTALDTAKKLHFYPNPCVITIDGIVIGLTSTDVMMHLSREEFSVNHHSDRLGRLCRHIILHQNFYPLFPPNNELNIEFTKYDYLRFPVTPHLIILPSDLRYFIKNICKSIIINPGRSSKNLCSRIRIDPIDESSYDGSIDRHTNVEIVKISNLMTA